MALVLKNLYRFDEFILDPANRSLTRMGAAIPLSAKSCQVLTYLVANPGRVVTKEELLKAVWPESFVEESNLPGYISGLRKALTDRAALITTVPGLGYKFNAIVEAETPSALSPVSSSVSFERQQMRETTHVVIRETSIPLVVAQPTALPFLRSRSRTLVYAAMAAATVAFAIWIGWRWKDSGNPGDHREIVLADLDNTTGDPDFDHTLNKVLQIDLQQSPYFSVVSDGRARKTLKLMGQPADEHLTDQLAHEVCQRLNGQVYLTPSIARLDGRYLLTLSANDCSDGHALSAKRKEVDSKHDVLAVFSAMISAARRDIGESRESLRRFDTPFFEEKTSSLEALKAYSDAERLGDAGKNTDAIVLMRHAIALDPQFAIAYADLGSFCYNLNDMVCSRAATTKAYALRDSVNEREQFLIEFRYAQTVTGDLHAMLDTLHQWSDIYPEDNGPLANLVNFETWTGQFAQAAADAERLQNLEHRHNINNGITLEIAARAYYHAHMPDRLRAVYAEAVQRKLDNANLHGLVLQQAAANGDQNGVDEQVAWAKGTPNESNLLQMASLAALSMGQPRHAASLFEQATSAARRDNLFDTTVDLGEYHARMLVELGLPDEARSVLKALPSTDPSLDKAFTETHLDLEQQALAEAGKQLANAPTDTLMTMEFVPSVQAAVALNHGKPEDAIRLLQADEPYEMREPTVPYLRGQAYLAAKRGKEAAAEFNKIAEKPWLADPPAAIVELAELGIARSLAQQGLTEQAIVAYRRFLTEWAQAEPSVPVLIQAKEELAALAPTPAAKPPL